MIKIAINLNVIFFLLCSLHLIASDRFKLAINRTYHGFEKGINHCNTIKPFTFIHATDPQFGLIEYKLHGDTHIAEWSAERRQLRQAIAEWNTLQPKPAFLIITGDLANAYPTNYPTLRRQQLDELKFELTQLDLAIPILFLPGNHDVEDEPTGASLASYRDEFGDDYYTFCYGKIKFIALNSQLYMAPEPYAVEEYVQQEIWLNRQLREVEKGDYKEVIVFQHIPWFLETFGEAQNRYFSLPFNETRKMLPKLYAANVRHIFAGHVHKNLPGTYDDLQSVVTTSTGWQNNLDGPAMTKAGYRIVSVEEAVRHRFVVIGQLATTSWGAGFWLLVTLIVLALSVYLPNVIQCR